MSVFENGTFNGKEEQQDVAIVYGSTYFSLDWHDWSSRNFTLGEEKGYIMKPDEIQRAIFDDAFEGIEITPSEREKAFHDFVTNREAKIEMDGEYGPITHTLVAQTDDTGREMCTASYDSGMGFTDIRYYGFDVLKADEVKYLPIREFVCAPKIVPSASRADTPYFDNLEDAKQAMSEMEHVDSHPFEEENFFILVRPKDMFDNSSWYQDQLKLQELRKEDPERYEATFSPFTDKHLAALEGTISIEEAVPLDGEGKIVNAGLPFIYEDGEALDDVLNECEETAENIVNLSDYISRDENER